MGGRGKYSRPESRRAQYGTPAAFPSAVSNLRKKPTAVLTRGIRAFPAVLLLIVVCALLIHMVVEGRSDAAPISTAASEAGSVSKIAAVDDALARRRVDYLIALDRARAAGSVDDVLRVTKAIRALGDRGAIAMSLHTDRDPALRADDVTRVCSYAHHVALTIRRQAGVPGPAVKEPCRG